MQLSKLNKKYFVSDAAMDDGLSSQQPPRRRRRNAVCENRTIGTTGGANADFIFSNRSQQPSSRRHISTHNRQRRAQHNAPNAEVIYMALHNSC